MALREGEMMVPPGTAIVRQGEVSRDVFYWTEGGRVRILVDGKPIRELEFTAYEKHFFGDLAAVLGRPRSATVECVTPNKFVHISFESGKLARLVQTSPEVTRLWLGSLARIAHDALTAVHARDKEIAATEAQIAEKEKEAALLARSWTGALFVARRTADYFSQPVLNGVAKYLEDIRLFDQALGDETAVEADLVDYKVRRLVLRE